MNSSGYPLRVTASLDPGLNRWLWLVKWLLVIPHYVVLFFLWICFMVLSVVAFLAILITGRYPYPIFEFNVGVLRWSWRVAYYAYGALGTDKYPPFTLHDVPDYPAHLEVSYPQHLSRGLVLVKWWLLAIPHYLVVAFFVGGSIYVAGEASGNGEPWAYTGGLISLLVLIAAVVLLFTGSYPRTIFDLVLGLNRWVLRVAAYAGLMTDEYPPFRLDMGGDDPERGSVTMTPPEPPPSASPTPTPTSTPPRHWTAGRIVAVVLGSLALLTAGGILTAGTTLLIADQTTRDQQGYIMTPDGTFSTDTFAIASETVSLPSGPGSWVPEELLGKAKLRAVSSGDTPLFIGVADSKDVSGYLSGVEHTTVVDWGDGSSPVYRDTTGGAPSTPPGGAGFWTAQTTGSGELAVTWPVEPGDLTLVVMNADATRGVSSEVAVGATFPALGPAIVTLFVIGGILLLVSLALIIGALVTKPKTGGPQVQPGAQP